MTFPVKFSGVLQIKKKKTAIDFVGAQEMLIDVNEI